MTTTLLTATYTDPNHNNPNIKSAGRLMTITREGDETRVRIVGEPFVTNDPMVVVMDERFTPASWAVVKSHIVTGLTALGASVTLG